MKDLTDSEEESHLQKPKRKARAKKVKIAEPVDEPADEPADEPVTEPADEPAPAKKEKKPRTQAQIDALNKGRAKALENREMNKKLRNKEFDESVAKVVESKVEKLKGSATETPSGRAPREIVEKVIEKHYYHEPVKGSAPETPSGRVPREVKPRTPRTPKEPKLEIVPPKKDKLVMHFC
jgi:hypothetical protein